MLPDKTNTDYYHTVESGNLKEYFFPGRLNEEVGHALQHPERCQLPEHHQAHDILLDECASLLGTEALGSQEGGLHGRGDLSRWFRKPGHRSIPEVTAELRSGAVSTWNTRPREGFYVHNKVILIDGTYQGLGGQKLVYATSQNLTLTSLRESNEVMLRIPNIPSVYTAYLNNFQQIKSQSVKIISSAAKTTAGVESTSEKRSSKAPKDNSPDPDE
jgi:hypothetical protein